MSAGTNPSDDRSRSESEQTARQRRLRMHLNCPHCHSPIERVDDTAEEEVFTAALRAKLSELTGEEFMTTFVREQVKPGTQMPPPRAMPPELQNRPAGIAAMLEAFLAYRFERERLRDCTFPVYLGYGDRTNDIESIKAGVLARLFMDFHVQRHAGIHHFVPPELIYSPAHVNGLQEIWLRAEAIAPPARVET